MRQVEKSLMLQILDQHWREHLHTLEHLRQVIGMRAYGQRDPLSEYKLEAFGMFSNMLDQLRYDVTRYVMNVSVEIAENVQTPEAPDMQARDSGPNAADREAFGKVPRNAPCPCGSGRKFKHCSWPRSLKAAFRRGPRGPWTGIFPATFTQRFR